MKQVARALLLVVASLSCGVVACSSDGSSATNTGAGTSSAPCSDVCKHVTSICGAALPGCEQSCAQWTASQRTCVSGAASCSSANSCGSTGNTGEKQPDDAGPTSSIATASCKDKGEACTTSKDCRSYDCYCTKAGISSTGSACSNGKCTDPAADCKSTCTGLMDTYASVRAGSCD